jgi:hypothetical protein
MEQEDMEPSNITIIISIIVYAFVTYALTEVFRRYRKIGAAFIILSLLTCPLWATNLNTWFSWAKIVSVLVPMVIVGFMRIAVYEDKKGPFWEIFKKPWALWFLFFILALNITEASIRDWEFGNYMNSLAGVCLILTIPFVGKFWRIETKTCGDLIADFPLGWCFLYTTWNAAFIFGCIPNKFAAGLAILIACELYSLFGRHDLYLMGRIYTLAFLVTQLATTGVLPFMDSSAWFSQNVTDMWGIFNIVCGVLYVIWYNWQMYTGACDRKFRHPATAPAGVFSDDEVANADTGIFARLYFHRSPSVNKASAIEGGVKC